MKRYDGQPSRAANKIASHWHARPGTKSRADTIPRRIQIHRAPWEQRANKILKELPGIPNMERFKRMAQTSARHLARQPAQQRPLTQEERDYETISLALLKGTPAEQVPEARTERP
jgi:preprotein translocase subunit SecD